MYEQGSTYIRNIFRRSESMCRRFMKAEVDKTKHSLISVNYVLISLNYLLIIIGDLVDINRCSVAIDNRFINTVLINDGHLLISINDICWYQ